MSESATTRLDQSVIQVTPVSSGKLWTGRVLSCLPALFLLFDGAMKLAKPEFVVKATVQLGYPEGAIVPLGLVLLAATILYVIPHFSPWRYPADRLPWGGRSEEHT